MLKFGFFNFHIVWMSPWPLYSSCGLFMILASTLLMKDSIMNFFFFIMVILFFFSSFYGWMRDICYESFLQGEHTFLVQKGLKTGMVLFILSEVFFFFSFFWSLFYFSFSPSIEIYSWPPEGIISLDPMEIPMLGTLILLSSGVTVTWSHYCILENKKKESMISLILTIIFGIFFSFLQLKEYISCSFTMSDSVFGSIFFMSTGFHGIHVLIGTMILFSCYTRMVNNHFSKNHHVGFEMGIWYWHFVDVVWLFLYICLYWWSY
uniref:cytochrome c oxidase subunit III n=1 Tax=Ciconiphilus decimfasciatus TaxID=2212705 RepID=UPI00257E9D4F|nr:cytochrome c oxidase subunit III [Ciconiphilus decimfasciatus]WGW14997.1 cytochrome c oxidase subunit 3 [Ciconiphilus decimfasciatus]